MQSALVEARMDRPVTVLISSRNRPLYLWACLDALYRHTTAPHRYILIDMASDDPLVAQVIHGFERRGMFDQVVRAERNDPAIVAALVFQNLDAWAPFFAYIESDVVVQPSDPCWLTRFTTLMDAHPNLAMLGSAIDKGDFVQPEDVEHLRGDRDIDLWRSLMKTDSPERGQIIDEHSGPLFQPHNPAGRLLMLRTQALKKIGLKADHALSLSLKQNGYETAIATGVIHRHLSLTQIYDYPDYDLKQRNRYMGSVHPPSA
jgi:hypothetical protein